MGFALPVPDMDRPLVAVVLAGGTGTRLYPAARSDTPKQFQSFGSEKSLLRSTVDRVDFADETYVLTRPAFADAVTEHAPGAAVLTEPEPRDTGPALVYAAHRIREQLGDCVMLVVPSDHHIDGDFEETARTAVSTAAETEGLVTMGVEPTRIETGYGYLKPGEEFEDYYTVEKFKEKPSMGAAERYRYHGYYWNVGIFCWTPDALLSAAADSDLGELVDALEAGDPEAGFEAVEPISIDYGVLEDADDVYLVPATFEWDDLGAWDAIARVLPSDSDDNAAIGETLTIDAESNVLASDGHVTAIGVEDLVVASFGDRTLVVPKRQSQRVRDAVDQLQDDGLF